MATLPSHGMRRRTALAALPLGLAAFAGPSRGQAFPSRPIKFIVASPAGTAADAAARYYASKLGQLTRQSVVVENQAGGNGFIAIGNVLRAPADGYTVLIGGTSLFTTNVVLFKQLPYDPIKDLIPVGLVIAGSFVMAVPASSPIHTLKDLVDRARAAPSALNSGTGAASYLLSLTSFSRVAGMRLNNVPYKGPADVSAAIASGILDVGLVDPPSSIPLAKAGKLRFIAAGGEQRIPELPDVPTFIEQGYPGFTARSWGAAALPGKTPGPIVIQYREWLEQITGSEETEAFFRRISAERGTGGWEGMQKLILTEIERWRSVAAEAGVTPQ